jgi:hypothetical protein
MSKQSMSVVGVINTFGTGVLNKIMFASGAFSAETPQSLPAPSTAPYVHSFLNTQATDPQFRVLLTEYTYVYGQPGTSTFWSYDSNGTGWGTPVFGGTSGASLSPRNVYAACNIPVLDSDNNLIPTKYLLLDDWDDNGSSVRSNISILEMDGSEALSVVSTFNFPLATTPNFEVHCQDLKVVLDPQTIDEKPVLVPRIFALVIVNNSAYTSYQNSILYELKFAITNGTPGLTVVSSRNNVNFNAVAIVPAHSNGLRLFLPCTGGPQGYGNSNGSASSLMVVNASNPSTLGIAQWCYFGYANPASIDIPYDQDFRSIAIDSSNNAYILTGIFDSSGTLFSWNLYQTDVATLLAAASTPPLGTIPKGLRIDNGQTQNGFFTGLGICRPDGTTTDYLIFAKGKEAPAIIDPNEYRAFDQIVWAISGSSWLTTKATIDADALSGTVGGDYAINSLDYSVPGGGVAPIVVPMQPSTSVKTRSNTAERDDHLKRKLKK